MNKDEILRQAAAAAEQAVAKQMGSPIQPQPVPTAVSVGQGTNPDGSLSVVLVFYTPLGQNVFFLPADSAKEISKAMQDAAVASGSGLVVPK